MIVLQGKEQYYRPELYIESAKEENKKQVEKTLESFITSISKDTYPGLKVVKEATRWRINIPDSYRVGHEAHFGQVTDQFLRYLDGEPVPEWETANLLAKYYITISGLKLCRKSGK